MPSDERQDNLAGLVETLRNAGDGDRVSLDDIQTALGRRAFGPLLLVVGLLSTLPTGLIPGMGYATATLMILLFGQLLFGMESVALPGALKRRGVGRDVVNRELDRLRPWAERVDRLTASRLRWLAEPPGVRLVAAVGVLLAATMYPLGPFPFGAFPGGGSTVLVGIGLTTRDGLFVAGGLTAGLLTTGALVGAVSLL